MQYPCEARENRSCFPNTLEDLPKPEGLPEGLLQCHPEDAVCPHLSHSLCGSPGMWACKLISENGKRIILAHKMRTLLNCLRQFKAAPSPFLRKAFLNCKVGLWGVKEEKAPGPSSLLFPSGAAVLCESDLLSGTFTMAEAKGPRHLRPRASSIWLEDPTRDFAKQELPRPPSPVHSLGDQQRPLLGRTC